MLCLVACDGTDIHTYSVVSNHIELYTEKVTSLLASVQHHLVSSHAAVHERLDVADAGK
jgi:hypothetical protein